MKYTAPEEPVTNLAAMTAKYTVLSDKVGEPGSAYVPGEGINVAALLEGGFIAEVKQPKQKNDTEE
jgi:hypothetical protein